MLGNDFLTDFKCSTEQKWSACSINPAIYGFQFQRGTRWNLGLSAEKIAEYERAIEVRFPDDFREFLRAMNGTDLPTLNVYGYCGEAHRRSIGVYSYPRDLEVVRRRIKDVREWWPDLVKTMAEQGFALSADSALVPIYIHPYVVCTSDPGSSVVLSIDDGSDAIVYGNSLEEYLRREFLRD
jgi:cell wall assembly regulator SMI1